MADISRITLPNGDTYNLKDFEMPQVKNALSLQNILYNATWEIGSINTRGVPADSTVRIRMADYVNIDATGLAIQIDDGYRAAVVWYAVDNSLRRDDYWLTGNSILAAPDGARKIKVVLEAVPSATASLDYANHINICVANSEGVDVYRSRDIPEGTDLDTLYQSGFYVLAYSGSYINTPTSDAGYRMLLVYTTYGSASSKRFQMFIDLTNLQLYVRFRTGGTAGTYTAWSRLNPDTSDIVADVIDALPIYDGTVV